MIELNKLVAAAEEVDTICSPYESCVNDIMRALNDTDFPYTYFSLFSFIPRVDGIRDSIFLLAKEGELYSIYILYRALIEHFVKHSYIYLRYLEDGNDLVGFEYVNHVMGAEDLQYATAWKQRSSILGKVLNFDSLEELHKLRPKLSGVTKKELLSIADKFHYKNIIHYVSERTKGIGQEGETFYPNILLKYSELSAYVHGGATTNTATGLLLDDGRRDAELIKISRMCLGLSVSVRQLTYVAFSHHVEELSELCKELDGVSSRYKI